MIFIPQKKIFFWKIFFCENVLIYGSIVTVRLKKEIPSKKADWGNLSGRLVPHDLRPKAPNTLAEAESIVREWVGYYNNVRLHRALSYIAPFDHLQGRSEEIFATRDAARFQRQVNRRQQQASNESDKKGKIANTVDAGYNKILSLEDRALLRSTPSAREILGKDPTTKEMPMPEEQILVFS